MGAFIESGITSWPELLANMAAAICRSNGAKTATAEMFRHWEGPLYMTEAEMIANFNQAYNVET